MSKKLEIKVPVEKQSLVIFFLFIILVCLTFVAMYPLVSSAMSNKMKLVESTNRLDTLQKNLSSERSRMSSLKQSQETKTGQAMNLKNSLNAMLWNNSKDVKYYIYDLSKTLKVNIVSIGVESSTPGDFFTTIDYPLVISGNYISVLEYIHMLENSDDLMYIGSNNVVIEQESNGKVRATLTVEADTK
ncbi:MAG: hypothetical protein NTX05_06425 [Fusobacteria bacterium]|nr:hypothetical protein [Fusobacteriota bacterium]